MAQFISDRRDIDFVLHEQLPVEGLLQYPRYADMKMKMFDMVVSEARNFGLKEILPTYGPGDREGARYENGQVRIPECFHRPHRFFVEDEWISLPEDPAWGGQGLPYVIAAAASEYIVGANFAFACYGTLGHGAGKMVELYGTRQQKEMFLRRLYTGQWGGTMVLTEPEAGSDVGNLTTTARRNEDGTYSISGNKIFITNGDHDLTENIVHTVLARVEGAPAGSRGISIFLVPKIWVRPDGSLAEPNDVVCTGIETKMGLHASPTCSLTFGGRGRCRGLLLGHENQGLKIMFHMMNEARLGVGCQGFLHASAAYLYALDYARRRRQGRDPAAGQGAGDGSVPIIRHPDVRRMLLWMKAMVEGMRSMVYYTAYCLDREALAADDQEREYFHDRVDLLTPLVKAYCSERGFEVCVQAIQVFGGYGYTREYPVEQLARDCKITSIYEGTNGIQAMDLLGRKLGVKRGAVFLELLQAMKVTVHRAAKTGGLGDTAEQVGVAVDRLGQVALRLGKKAQSEEFPAAFAHAHPFLECFGDVFLGWMHLWRARTAWPRREKLLAGRQGADRREFLARNRGAAFYDGQVRSARWYVNTLLPPARGKMTAILNADDGAVAMQDSAFGG